MTRCEAIRICGHERGTQCTDAGELRDNGRTECWTHWRTRLVALRTIEYVRRGPNLEGLLEMSVRVLGGKA
ncbi:MAG: hypothetical protein EPO32_14845 [Anaerolineae bacterium]|nr:MAG: hypothetical protein EPO32_14845 [Anaerolineae bacterium]